MIVPEEVVPEPAPLPHLLQKVRQFVWPGPHSQQFILDTGRRAVGHDVVHIPAGLVQILSGLQVLLPAGQFLFPPGPVIDPESRPPCVEQLELLEELGIVRLQDAVLDIVAAGPAHGEDPLSVYFKHLAAFQQEYRGADPANLPTLPLLQWIGPQGVVVFMVACYK